MKIYLHAYIAYTQDNWVNYLPMAKFTASNHVNAFIGITIFFADHRFHPRIGIKAFEIYKDEQQAELLTADKIVYRQKETMSFLQDQLA